MRAVTFCLATVVVSCAGPRSAESPCEAPVVVPPVPHALSVDDTASPTDESNAVDPLNIDLVLWLARRQSAGGHWELDPKSVPCAGRDEAFRRIELTSWALLAVAESSLQGDTRAIVDRAVRRGAAWLIGEQGAHRDERRWDAHAQVIPGTRQCTEMTTLVLAECYRAVGEPSWRPALERAAMRLAGQDFELGSSARDGCVACSVYRDAVTVLAFRALARSGIAVSPSVSGAAVARVRAGLREIVWQIDPKLPGFPSSGLVRCGDACDGEWAGVAAGLFSLLASEGEEEGATTARALEILVANAARCVGRDTPVDFKFWVFGTWATERSGQPAARHWATYIWGLVLDTRNAEGAVPYDLNDGWSRSLGIEVPAAAMSLIDTFAVGGPRARAGAGFRFLWP